MEWRLVVVLALGLLAFGDATRLHTESGALAECGTSCGCQPWCHWNCTVPVPKKVCRPVCLKPKCHVACEPVKCLKCEANCTAQPKCRILCPKYGCLAGSCPQCKYVCDPAPPCASKCSAPEKPQCVPQCETKCWSKCATEYEGEIDRPQCEMVCGFPDCPSHCRSSMPAKCAKHTEAPPKCCGCSKHKNAATAVAMANSGCHSPDCKNAPKPSLLEVMSNMQSRGSSCCPCGQDKDDSDTELEVQKAREVAEAQQARAKAMEKEAGEEHQRVEQLLAAQAAAQRQQAAKLQQLEGEAAYGLQQAALAKKAAMEQIKHTPFFSSYDDLVAKETTLQVRPRPPPQYPVPGEE